LAYTLLNAVNLTLKRVRIIQGDVGDLTSLTDTGHQADIDIMVQAWNEAITDLYDAGAQLPQDVSEGTFTLVAAQREYDVPATFDVMMSNTMVDQTNGQYLYPYPGGFSKMFTDQTQPANYTGLPIYWCLNPTTGKIRIDRGPDTGDAGRIYTFIYRKRLYMSAAADTFPFNDTIVNDLVQAVKEVWNRESKEKFDAAAYQKSMARAADHIRQQDYPVKY
jgi:hypothetical protein